MLELKTIENFFEYLSAMVWGLPIVIFILLASLIFTFTFKGLQFRYFFSAWKYIFSPEKSNEQTASVISPLQAFINALSSSLGNGGLAGMATVLVDGGPGTVFWIFILGFFSMIIRFTEVYAATRLSFSKKGKAYEGPLGYIASLPCGSFFVYLYSSIMLVYILFAGNAMQCNSMGISLAKITGWSMLTIAILLCLIVLYIVCGGAKRIMRVAEAIIPIKVILFFVAVFFVLFYHHDRFYDALKLILANAFNTDAFGKGLIVFSIQQAISVGFSRALNATEAGVGTASIFFGAARPANPLKTSIMSIITAFISTNLVCAMLILSLVMSGVWNTGATGIQLVISSFTTAMGSVAGPLITFLSFSFGLGVLVAYAFLGQKIWEFLFGLKGRSIYIILFVAVSLLGTLSSVKLIWNSLDFLAGVLIFINILGLLWVLPSLSKAFNKDINNL